jgi:hypothetical protein
MLNELRKRRLSFAVSRHGISDFGTGKSHAHESSLIHVGPHPRSQTCGGRSDGMDAATKELRGFSSPQDVQKPPQATPAVSKKTSSGDVARIGRVVPMQARLSAL